MSDKVPVEMTTKDALRIVAILADTADGEALILGAGQAPTAEVLDRFVEAFREAAYSAGRSAAA